MSTIKRACCQCGADYRFPIWQQAPKACEGCFLPLAWSRWEVEEHRGFVAGIEMPLPSGDLEVQWFCLDPDDGVGMSAHHDERRFVFPTREKAEAEVEMTAPQPGERGVVRPVTVRRLRKVKR